MSDVRIEALFEQAKTIAMLLEALQNLLAHEGEEETNAIGITCWTEARRDAIYAAEAAIAKAKGT